MKVIWSPLALERIREQSQYIARDDPTAARGWIGEVFASVEQLKEFPRSGRVVPELRNPDTRELLVRGHRVIYRLHDETISVLTIRHARQHLSEDELEE